MHAAVVESFGHPPRYRAFEEPAARAGEVLVEMRAAALSALVRAQASGAHYSAGAPPFVPGADGVGRLADGRRVYVAFPRPPVGTMAERVAVPLANTAAVLDDVGDVTAAAIANPGMSSWAALVERARLQPGESVLVIGATSLSGRLAVRIARHLGASRLVATARDPSSEAALLALGADAFVPTGDPGPALADRFRSEIAEGIDVVLDYVWGAPAEAFVAAATGHGSKDAARRIRFVNIGSLGGGVLTLPAAALRSSGLELVGSGLGSLSHEALVRSVAGVLAAVRPAGLQVEAEAIPLAQVEAAWEATRSGARIVFTP